MIPVMFRDLRIQSVLAAIVLLTGLGWFAALVASPMGQMFVCGPGGLIPLIPAWDSGRAAAFLGTSSVMAGAMMLPCAAGAIARSSWANRRRTFVFAAAASFAAGYLGVVMTAGAVGGIAEWVLESTGAMETEANNFAPDGALLTIAAVLLLWQQRRWLRHSVPATCPAGTPPSSFLQGVLHGRASLASCGAMICLQLVGGAMNTAWMALIAAWMLASAILASTTRHRIWPALPAGRILDDDQAARPRLRLERPVIIDLSH